MRVRGRERERERNYLENLLTDNLVVDGIQFGKQFMSNRSTYASLIGAMRKNPKTVIEGATEIDQRKMESRSPY